MKTYLLFLLLSVSCSFGQVETFVLYRGEAQLFVEGKPKKADEHVIERHLHRMELPSFQKDACIIGHSAYTLSYNEAYEQADWVAYRLTKFGATPQVARSNHFIEDPYVPTGSARTIDYAESGYDRGHLAPAADMESSETSMQESFYFSNMSPQLPGFNRGIWANLESLVRTWALNYDTVYVVTGPLFLGANDKTIGPDSVAVPPAYFKAILYHTDSLSKCIGFVLNNESSQEKLTHFALSVDSLEAMSGLDFFPMLADSLENRIEAHVQTKDWLWTAQSPTSTHSNQPSNSSQAVQCSGITQKGARCRNMTTNPSGKCYLHEGK